jgi:hypothetical protein
MDTSEVIKTAFRLNGVNTIDDDNLALGLTLLNAMLASWGVEGLSIPCFTKEDLALSSGKGIYTIGLVGELATARPNRITDAYIKDSNNHYHPLVVHNNAQEYFNQGIRNVSNIPHEIFYDPSYPLGTIYFDSLPDNSYILELHSEKNFENLKTLGAILSVPPEYYEAILYNLAVRVSIALDNQPSQYVANVANLSKGNLENKNAKYVMDKKASFDSALLHSPQR